MAKTTKPLLRKESSMRFKWKTYIFHSTSTIYFTRSYTLTEMFEKHPQLLMSPPKKPTTTSTSRPNETKSPHQISIVRASVTPPSAVVFKSCHQYQFTCKLEHEMLKIYAHTPLYICYMLDEGINL